MSESDCSHGVTVDAGMLGLKGGVWLLELYIVSCMTYNLLRRRCFRITER